jgi:hypothetical protein
MGHDPSIFGQPHFRIRRTDDEGLNDAFAGGDPAEDTNATIATGVLFRIRFKVEETNTGTDTTGFKLQVDRNGGGYAEVGVYTAASGIGPAVSLLSSQYANEAAITTERLTNDGGTWVEGLGMEADSQTSNFSLQNQETEIEFCLMIHSFHDGYVQNVAGDTLTFRLVENDDTAFTGGYVSPVITVAETAGFIGGVMIETCSNIGPFCDGNGNLYLLTEISHTGGNIDMVMIKSTDGGDTWREMDGANRPTSQDLEAIDIQQDGTDLHIMFQGDETDMAYNVFHTSDDGADPDEWWAGPEEIPDAGLANTINCQCAGISVLGDGALWAFWIQNDGAFDYIAYKKRTAAGVWDVAESDVDNTANTDFTGFTVIRGAQQNGAGSELTHIFYQDYTNLTIYHKSLTSAGVLSARQSCEADADGEFVPLAQAVYWDDGGDEVVMCCVLDASDEKMYSVVVTNDGDPEARKAVSDNTVGIDLIGGDQPSASLAIDTATSTAYFHYVDSATKDLFRDSAVNDGGWGVDVEEADARDIYMLRSRVFTHNAGNGSAKVVGYAYTEALGDNDPTYNGFQWYGEYEIPAAAGRTTYNTDSHPLGVHTGMGWRFGNP